MKVKVGTTNWVCGEIFSANRIELRFDTLVIEGDGVDISVPFNPGDLEVQIQTYMPRGITLALEDKYRLEGPSGVAIRSFHDGHFEIGSHRDLFKIKVWKYKAVTVQEAE